nr:MAG TPA: hypothetical protein [Caudoviricetes sp.]
MEFNRFHISSGLSRNKHGISYLYTLIYKDKQ